MFHYGKQVCEGIIISITQFISDPSIFRVTGIAIWVLTGDKPETAINIAYSAKLFQSNMELLKYDFFLSLSIVLCI